MASEIELFLADEAATARLGADLALALRAGDLIALSGDLGTGKTSLARALIRAMAQDMALEVPSPTYTLVQAYEARIPIHHFDLYRLSDPEEIEELGLIEALQTGAALVEWPERAALPMPQVKVVLDHTGQGRSAKIIGEGSTFERIARSLAIREFLAEHGWDDAERRYLLGDASARSYETIHISDKPQRILMNSPKLVLGAPVLNGKPYAVIAHTAQTVSAFVAIDHILREAGVSAPQIFASDLDIGLLLVEHLGSGTFVENGQPVAERYEAAAKLLADMHNRPWPVTIKASGAKHTIQPFDRDAMMIELSLLVEWYLPYVTGTPASDTLKRDFESVWNNALDRIAGTEKSLLMRDFHSPNIVWRPERKGNDRLGIIDFQDAMIGPTAYDLASLAMDARVTITPELEATTVAAYIDSRTKVGGFDREAFELAYALMAAHRNSKILGGFVRLDRRDGKPIYLKHLPRIRSYVRRALAHEQLGELRSFYEENRLLDEGAS